MLPLAFKSSFSFRNCDSEHARLPIDVTKKATRFNLRQNAQDVYYSNLISSSSSEPRTSWNIISQLTNRNKKKIFLV